MNIGSESEQIEFKKSTGELNEGIEQASIGRTLFWREKEPYQTNDLPGDYGERL